MNALLRATVLFLGLAGASLALGQSYSLDWFTVDGGGGISTGGGYCLSGTIGQPDGGVTMKGGAYTLDCGFWAIVAAPQAPDRPSLFIARNPANTVTISWPSPSTGWKLQQNTNLSTVSWSDVQTTPDDDGTTRHVTVKPAAGACFYRLKNQ